MPQRRSFLRLAEEVERVVLARFVCRRADKEEEREVEVGERRPGEDELNGIVYKLDLQDDLAEEVLAGRPDAEEHDSRVNAREE